MHTTEPSQTDVNITPHPSSINRGSYMSAHVLLNLLNELGKIDKFKNTRARMLDSIYHMTNTLKSHF